MSSEFCRLRTTSDPLDIGAVVQGGQGFQSKQGIQGLVGELSLGAQGLVGELGWGAQWLVGELGVGDS